LPPAQVSFSSEEISMATSTNPRTSETAATPTANQARDGVTGHGVRYVLVTSTAAVIILFGAVWLYFFH
jgi:hypothetical protein